MTFYLSLSILFFLFLHSVHIEQHTLLLASSRRVLLPGSRLGLIYRSISISISTSLYLLYTYLYLYLSLIPCFDYRKLGVESLRRTGHLQPSG